METRTKRMWNSEKDAIKYTKSSFYERDAFLEIICEASICETNLVEVSINDDLR
jgi:hypothetical protein